MKITINLFVLLILPICHLFCQQPGELDLDFGTNGKVVTNIKKSYNQCKATTLQPDGKIIAVGNSYNSANWFDMLVMRLHSDGTLDEGFGQNGIVLQDAGSPNDIFYAVVLQEDGKIVAAGYSGVGFNNDFVVARFLSNGSLDTAFGSMGVVKTDIFDSEDKATALSIQSDGKIVVAGTAKTGSYDDFAIIRLLPEDGTLDNTFHDDGKLLVDVSFANDKPVAVAFQNDAKIVIAGNALTIGDIALVRLLANGTPDPDFGNNGIATSNILNKPDGASSLKILPDGKLLVAGYIFDGVSGDDDMAVYRFHSDGELDDSFGNGGIASIDFFISEDRALALHLDIEGRILLAGNSTDNNDSHLILARFLSEGTVDLSFGNSGKDTLSNAIGFIEPSFVFMADDKLLAAGNWFNGLDYDVILARFFFDGTLDLPFGTNGKTIADIGSTADYGYALAAQPDGKLVMAGIITDGNREKAAVVRYQPDGTPDDSFGNQGRLVFQGEGVVWRRAFDVVVQPDGKILFAGTVHSGDGWDFYAYRLMPDGATDNSFGTNGERIIDLGTFYDYGYSMTLQEDGKIVLAGVSGVFGNFQVTVVRLTKEGQLDGTFGSNGKVITPVSTGNDYARKVLVQPDGKILVAGSTFQGGYYKALLIRYQSNGSPDNSFGSNGIVQTDFGTKDDWAEAATLALDGKILITGYSGTSDGEDVLVARYDANGTLDTSFDGDGSLTLDIQNFADRGNAILVQPDGRVLVAGYAASANQHDFLALRLNENGSLDGDFADGGKAVLDFNQSDDLAFDMAAMPDGNIALAGRSVAGAEADFAVARFFANMNTVASLETPKPALRISIYPNPFVAAVRFKYRLEHPASVRLAVLDASGRLVETLVEEYQVAGEHLARWKPQPVLLGGAYFYLLQVGNSQCAGKLLRHKQ